MDEPVFVRRGDGAIVEDVDGNRYVDWVQSWGPLIFGHADPETLGGGPRRGRSRHDVRRADRGRGRARSRDRRRRAVHRDGAARQLGHRGVDERAPARTGGDPPRPRDQVRRLLPRSRRRAPRERRLRGDDARHPLDPGRADRGHRRHDRLRVQRRRRRRRGVRALRGGARGDRRRARCGEHGLRPARAGLPRGAALARGRDRRAARVRRGDDRLPGRPRRRAGALRRDARPHDPREDRRRRPPCRGLRRPRPS